jgi:CDP-diglyceride synthetase
MCDNTFKRRYKAKDHGRHLDRRDSSKYLMAKFYGLILYICRGIEAMH